MVVILIILPYLKLPAHLFLLILLLLLRVGLLNFRYIPYTLAYSRYTLLWHLYFLLLVHRLYR